MSAKFVPKVSLLLIGFFAFLLFSAQNSQAQNPLQYRARALSDTAGLRLAIDNYGRFAGVAMPMGLWGDFQYISNMSFILGIPGKDKNGRPYPWAVGSKKAFDTSKNQFYTVGDDTTYWGPTVSESWADDSPRLTHTDWEAIGGLNNPAATISSFYQESLFTLHSDSLPLIATSTIPESWPLSHGKPFWPGPWAVDPDDPSGQEKLRQIFISDQDIYFAFDDRYANRDDDPHQGYSTGVRVDATCHAFSDSATKGMIFFDLILRNQSAYDYTAVYAGLYFDVDAYTALADGHYYGRTNDDDWAGFNRALGLGYIYDPDGDHQNPYVGEKKLSYIGLKFLQTPLAAQNLDLNEDGVSDIYTGSPLGVTGFHWFDWYYLPGLRFKDPIYQEGPRISTSNKEEIQYRILAGDATHISAYDSLHFFHLTGANGRVQSTARFASPKDLQREYPQGTDCVLMLSTGPFDLPSGGTQPFSFCLIAAADSQSLTLKARLAQTLFDNNYTSLNSVRKRLQVVKGYALEQNYPNPFNAKTKIVFRVPEPQNVRLDMFDLRGRKIRTLLNEFVGKGQHTHLFDFSKQASGLYFYRLTTAKGWTKTRKMLLIK